jgi:antirestriction protein ArdC
MRRRISVPDNTSHHRFDVYTSVTESIIQAIEAGAGTFTMPWHGPAASITKPENAHTRMEYHGVNVVALWAHACLRGFESGFWASYKQWQQSGAQVRRGERGTPIVFFKPLDLEGDVDEEVDPHSGRRLVARTSRVFNADQVTGWQPPVDRAASNPAERLASAEAFIAATCARITQGGTRAFYDVLEDAITVPECDRFKGSATSTPTEAYYATVLHELIHWTGADFRLDRKLRYTSQEELAAEELIAEIGAAFLCADFGVSNSPRPDHAAYVAYWLKLLRHDTRAVFTASRLANIAANYLHELVAYRL